MRYLIGWFRLLLLLLYTLFVVLVILFVFPLVSRKIRHRLIRSVAAWLPGLLGVRLRIQGEVPPLAPGEPGYLVCSNHISCVDIFVIDAVLPCRFVAKKEIASWPVFGRIAKGVETLFIDRKRRRAVLEIAQTMGEALKEGTNVIFFPEGTTSTGEGLLAFHANLFEPTQHTPAKVLPIVLRYTQHGEPTTQASYAGDIDLWTVVKNIVFSSGLAVQARVLTPIDSRGKTRQDLCREAAAVMARALDVPDTTAIKEAERLKRLKQDA